MLAINKVHDISSLHKFKIVSIIIQTYLIRVCTILYTKCRRQLVFSYLINSLSLSLKDKLYFYQSTFYKSVDCNLLDCLSRIRFVENDIEKPDLSIHVYIMPKDLSRLAELRVIPDSFGPKYCTLVIQILFWYCCYEMDSGTF